MSVSRFNYFEVSGRTQTTGAIDWNNHKEICHSLILDTIDFLDRYPNLPINRETYVYMYKLKRNGYGFDVNYPGPMAYYIKCEILQDVISASYPYIVIVKDMYNKTVNNQLLPSCQVNIEKNLSLMEHNGHPFTIANHEAKCILTISAKAKNILDNFKLEQEKLAMCKNNEKQELLEQEKSCCRLF